MPFTDPVSSISGRNSRASNVSGATGASRSARSPPPPNDTLSNAGVLSMLKTSTDTGDIGALSFNSSRLPSMPRAAHPRRGHAPRPSISAQYMSGATSNHSYAPSQTSRVSSQWDAGSTMQRRGSFTSMQSMPPSLPPAHLAKPSLAMMPPASSNPRDSRSFSMTSAPARESLPRHRSATSLRSQGHEHRHAHRMPPGPVPPMPENRPFVYPTRLKRPGYRSPSPALSDTYAAGAVSGPPPIPGRMPAIPMVASPPMSDQTYPMYPMAYSAVYPQDPRHLNVRPPPRTANSSPGLYDQAQYAFRSGPARAPAMPYPMMGAPPQHQMRPRAGYQGPHYGPPRPPYTPYAHVPHPGYRAPPSTHVGPMAHQMFHNAARMARAMPHRADTPMTDIGPPSSDPPSSGSPPTSSNPPTPKDNSVIQVAVNPAFINPDLIDLPESSSDPVLTAKYFDYADGLERPIHEPDVEVPHSSVPPNGFVQRVKAMLESKAAAEAAAARHELEKISRVEPGHERDIGHDTSDISEFVDYHELAANETPRFTIIEEFQAPVELPASPVKVAELEAVEVMPRQTQRITREMVKAELGPSSVDNTIQNDQSGDSTTHLLITMQNHDEPRTSDPERNGSGQACNGDAAVVTAFDAPGESGGTRFAAERAETNGNEASLPAAADLAMRFSEPIDNTTASDETQSRDPFVLDADTVTLEQQQSKNSLREDFKAVQYSVTPEPPPESDTGKPLPRSPVSPLREDEECKRSSGVSPVRTEYTLGIDETLRLDSEVSGHTQAAERRSNLEALQSADTPPQPTPRTPKTYSKSVQLRPYAALTERNSAGSHRFSLPGDFSTMVDTTFNSGTDMVTDIAVRFSLPGTSISTARPQIVDVSNSSTPEKPSYEALVQQHHHAINPRPTRRSSVTFADEIAPLNISKNHGQLRQVQPSAEAGMNKGRSIIRKPPQDDLADPKINAHEYTADLRVNNNLDNPGFRSGNHYLPGLKEESIEDMSISDHRRASASEQFLLPARIAAVKAMQERRLQDSADKGKARRQAQQYNRSLAETRDLPSLNFSRTDLIDRLNEALDVRSSKSLDVVRRRDFSNIYCPSPQRPESTEPLRERYTSFFSKPEDFTSFHEDDTDDEQTSEPEPQVVPVPKLQIQEQTEIEGEEPVMRSLSPDDFLNVANQVQRLSIPTVSGLSEKLSELIPGLRNLSNFKLDSFFSSDRQSLFSVPGNELARPDTVMTSRTSAGFRTLAERAEEFVQHGMHDSIGLFAKSLNKDLPPLPESVSVDKLSKVGSTEGKQSYLSGSVSAPVDLAKGPTRPGSALIRQKAPTCQEEVSRLLPKEMNPITRNAKRSIVLSHPTSRPWNLDENYPWSGNEVEIDLSVPSGAHTRDSLPSEVLRERTGKSLDLSRPIEPSGSTKGIDIGSITTEYLDCSASVTTEQATGITPQHTRRHSKRSIIGSISKKFGICARSTSDEETIATSLPKSPLPPRRTSTRQSHKPGDRYPTSSLTPPANFNLDEVRSFFSDNSSERDRTGSFRKRFTNFKSKKTGRPDQMQRGHSFEGDTAYDAGMMIHDDRLEVTSRAHIYDGIGMGKTEFHIKRFGEKLRQLFAKGSELFRSLSVQKTKKPEHGRDDWLADSVYSGV